MKLILCAGDRHIAGFKTHDVRPLKGIDYVCDFYDIPNTIKEKFEEIHFTHALEHFPTAETQKILSIVKELLVDVGRLYIEVPNFAWHAQLVKEGRERDAVYYAFGGQLDQWDFHKTGFTPSIIEEELLKAGFNNIRVQDGSSISVWSTK